MTGFPGETEELAKIVPVYRGASIYLLTRLRMLGAARHRSRCLPKPGPNRARAHTRLREISERKNFQFRRQMLRRTFSAVALGNGRVLTSNYPQVGLAAPHPARLLIEVKIGSVTEAGLREAELLSIFQ
jgi:hypothetical protein